MGKTTFDSAIDSIVASFAKLQEEHKLLLRNSVRGFKRIREIAAGEYPIAMTGLVSAELGLQENFCEGLTVILFRGRNPQENLAEIKLAVVEKFKEEFDNFELSNIEFGDLFPGFTESAEVETLPDGAYLASWLGIERPVEGFYIAFNITTDAS
ncbi:hypothetical protein KAH81_04685 [bacterium]|nr:hypothetical protein [bacterium]